MSGSDRSTADRLKRGRPCRITIVAAIIVFMLFAPEMMEGKYMEPTMKDGQVFVVSKARYSAKRKSPERDRLVILDKKFSLDAGAEDNIMSRVIGLPGDTVEITEGKVLVNGEEYTTRNGIRGAAGEVPLTKLEGNQVFLLSDHRGAGDPDSSDSALGPVDMRKIKGNVLFRIWPLKQIASMRYR